MSICVSEISAIGAFPMQLRKFILAFFTIYESLTVPGEASYDFVPLTKSSYILTYFIIIFMDQHRRPLGSRDCINLREVAWYADSIWLATKHGSIEKTFIIWSQGKAPKRSRTPFSVCSQRYYEQTIQGTETSVLCKSTTGDSRNLQISLASP